MPPIFRNAITRNTSSKMSRERFKERMRLRAGSQAGKERGGHVRLVGVRMKNDMPVDSV